MVLITALSLSFSISVLPAHAESSLALTSQQPALAEPVATGQASLPFLTETVEASIVPASSYENQYPVSYYGYPYYGYSNPYSSYGYPYSSYGSSYYSSPYSSYGSYGYPYSSYGSYGYPYSSYGSYGSYGNPYSYYGY
jgi:peroxin-13